MSDRLKTACGNMILPMPTRSSTKFYMRVFNRLIDAPWFHGHGRHRPSRRRPARTSSFRQWI